jgi:hypothetical protein
MSILRVVSIWPTWSWSVAGQVVAVFFQQLDQLSGKLFALFMLLGEDLVSGGPVFPRPACVR